MSAAVDFAASASADVRLVRFGAERRPVAIVDDFLKQPQALLDIAGRGEGFAPDPANFYPGVRKPLPDGYAAVLEHFVDAYLRGPFAIDPARRPHVVFCGLSMATRPPASLMPIQSIPHFDTSEAHQIAVVHYLCDPRWGGTSFYRHRATGFEAITNERAVPYRKMLERQATTVGLPAPQYINGDTDLFERIGAVEARFNRAIFYCSNVLHAGSIDATAGLSADPRQGRLTATAFVRLDLS
ncbi:MAG: hypothetical protein D6782_00095 [Alphaproteobacteria bacterium]|nr:MAG: hypothetical protein D6782_00095 [Alphaproteobacteria bacterium]